VHLPWIVLPVVQGSVPLTCLLANTSDDWAAANPANDQWTSLEGQNTSSGLIKYQITGLMVAISIDCSTRRRPPFLSMRVPRTSVGEELATGHPWPMVRLRQCRLASTKRPAGVQVCTPPSGLLDATENLRLVTRSVWSSDARAQTMLVVSTCSGIHPLVCNGRERWS